MLGCRMAQPNTLTEIGITTVKNVTYTRHFAQPLRLDEDQVALYGERFAGYKRAAFDNGRNTLHH